MKSKYSPFAFNSRFRIYNGCESVQRSTCVSTASRLSNTALGDILFYVRRRHKRFTLTSSSRSLTTMSLCGELEVFDLGNDCVRASWSAIFLAAFVLALCLTAIPITNPLRKITRLIKLPFHPFLTLSEAESLDQQQSPGAWKFRT